MLKRRQFSVDGLIIMMILRIAFFAFYYLLYYAPLYFLTAYHMPHILLTYFLVGETRRRAAVVVIYLHQAFCRLCPLQASAPMTTMTTTVPAVRCSLPTWTRPPRGPPSRSRHTRTTGWRRLDTRRNRLRRRRRLAWTERGWASLCLPTSCTRRKSHDFRNSRK